MGSNFSAVSASADHDPSFTYPPENTHTFPVPENSNQVLTDVDALNRQLEAVLSDRALRLRVGDRADFESRQDLLWSADMKLFLEQRNEDGEWKHMRTLSVDDFYAKLAPVKAELAFALALIQPDLEECSVCMDRLASTHLLCSHNFCGECIREWGISHSTCPLCRTAMRQNESWELAQPSREDVEMEVLKLFE